MTKESNPTALIVGAGPGGLASALLLQHSGVDVTIVELVGHALDDDGRVDVPAF